MTQNNRKARLTERIQDCQEDLSVKLLNSVTKPEYLFHPSQIWVRLRREGVRANEEEKVMLPWGLAINVHPQEAIGGCIWRVGIYDLCVSECLWRLTAPGDTCIDIGANIGHMTAIMALRAGVNGQVIALEPHPGNFRALETNALAWSGDSRLAPMSLREIAASDHSGRAQLHIPARFDENRGIASLEIIGDIADSYDVKLAPLDDLLPRISRVGVVKLDVEGHELAVLHGGQRLLQEGMIRDVVFEEHGTPPTPVTRLLESYGYEVFYLDQSLFGPRMVSTDHEYARRRVDAPNCLATSDPVRARELLSARGWKALRGQRTKITI